MQQYYCRKCYSMGENYRIDLVFNMNPYKNIYIYIYISNYWIGKSNLIRKLARMTGVYSTRPGLTG